LAFLVRAVGDPGPASSLVRTARGVEPERSVAE